MTRSAELLMSSRCMAVCSICGTSTYQTVHKLSLKALQIAKQQRGPLCRQDICALKRLQRDAFEQLLRTSERLEDLDQGSGASERGAAAGNTLLGGRAWRHKGDAGTSGRPHLQMSGQLVYAREMVSLEVHFASMMRHLLHCLSVEATNSTSAAGPHLPHYISRALIPS